MPYLQTTTMDNNGIDASAANTAGSNTRARATSGMDVDTEIVLGKRPRQLEPRMKGDLRDAAKRRKRRDEVEGETEDGASYVPVEHDQSAASASSTGAPAAEKTVSQPKSVCLTSFHHAISYSDPGLCDEAAESRERVGSPLLDPSHSRLHQPQKQ